MIHVICRIPLPQSIITVGSRSDVYSIQESERIAETEGQAHASARWSLTHLSCYRIHTSCTVLHITRKTSPPPPTHSWSVIFQVTSKNLTSQIFSDREHFELTPSLRRPPAPFIVPLADLILLVSPPPPFKLNQILAGATVSNTTYPFFSGFALSRGEGWCSPPVFFSATAAGKRREERGAGTG